MHSSLPASMAAAPAQEPRPVDTSDSKTFVSISPTLPPTVSSSLPASLPPVPHQPRRPSRTEDMAALIPMQQLGDFKSIHSHQYHPDPHHHTRSRSSSSSSDSSPHSRTRTRTLSRTSSHSPILLDQAAGSDAARNRTTSGSPRKRAVRVVSRGNQSKDAKAVRKRMQQLWRNTSIQPQPKNYFIPMEDSLAAILQIVPPIVQNARAMSNPLLNPNSMASSLYPSPSSSSASSSNPSSERPSMTSISIATPGTTLASIPTTVSAVSTSSIPPPRPRTISTTSMIPGPFDPVAPPSIPDSNTSTITHPNQTQTPASRSRTTSSSSTVSARFQIATGILQPNAYPLTNPSTPSKATTPMRSPKTALPSLNEPSLASISNSELTVASLAIPATSAISTSNHSQRPSDMSLERQEGATLLSSLMANGQPSVAESQKVLVSSLLSLSTTFTNSIKALCEQQNEIVLRFDDDMILELLTRWEQDPGLGLTEVPAQSVQPFMSSVSQQTRKGKAKIGKQQQQQQMQNHPLQNLRNNNSINSNSTTSLVTLGATDALERYQNTVGRVWEETEIILASIRKVKELVEHGRIQNYHDFKDEDSEEDAVARDDEQRDNLYPNLLSHANTLITVLGEFIECVSRIQEVVGTIRSQQQQQQQQQHQRPINPIPNPAFMSTTSVAGNNTDEYSVMEGDQFFYNEPRPIKRLDESLTRKLKKKNRFKTFSDKIRRSLSDFAKRSNQTLQVIFPPLGDGTNDGFHWDSYEDDYDSESGWAFDMCTQSSVTVGTTGTNAVNEVDQHSPNHLTSSPSSPDVRQSSKKIGGVYQNQAHNTSHRRNHSKESVVNNDQYWPGSIPILPHHQMPEELSPMFSSSSLASVSSAVIGPSTTSPVAPSFASHPALATGPHHAAQSPTALIDAHAAAVSLGLPSPTQLTSLSQADAALQYQQHYLQSQQYHQQIQQQQQQCHHPIQVPDLSTLRTDTREKDRQSILFRRRGPRQRTFTGASISAPLPVNSRPYSVHSSGSEPLTPTRNNYRKSPPKLPKEISPEIALGTSGPSSFDHLSPSSNGGNTAHRSSSLLAPRSSTPLSMGPLILDSPFTRQTSIRMGHDRKRYSVKMPTEEIGGLDQQIGSMSTGSQSSTATSSNDPAFGFSSPTMRPASTSSTGGVGGITGQSATTGRSSTSFWRRRSYNDALRGSGSNTLKLDIEDPDDPSHSSWIEFMSDPCTDAISGRPLYGMNNTPLRMSSIAPDLTSSNGSEPTTPTGPTFELESTGSRSQSRSSVRVAMFEFKIPSFSSVTRRSTNSTITHHASKTSANVLSDEEKKNRRHSSPLMIPLDYSFGLLSRRGSVNSNSNKSVVSTSTASAHTTNNTPSSGNGNGTNSNRSSVHLMPTVLEDSLKQSSNDDLMHGQERSLLSSNGTITTVSPTASVTKSAPVSSSTSQSNSASALPPMVPKSSASRTISSGENIAAAIAAHSTKNTNKKSTKSGARTKESKSNTAGPSSAMDPSSLKQRSFRYKTSPTLKDPKSHEIDDLLQTLRGKEMIRLEAKRQQELAAMEESGSLSAQYQGSSTHHGSDHPSQKSSGFLMGEMRKVMGLDNQNSSSHHGSGSQSHHQHQNSTSGGSGHLIHSTDPNIKSSLGGHSQFGFHQQQGAYLKQANLSKILHMCENGADVLVMEMAQGKLQVVAGTAEKLVERLADENKQDEAYIQDFLLSHSFFIQSEDLLECLIARFHIQPRPGEILYFQKWQRYIQLQVLVVIRTWIQLQFEDFELSEQLLQTLKEFMRNDVPSIGPCADADWISKQITVRTFLPNKNCSVIVEQGRFCLQRSRTRKISLTRSASQRGQQRQPSASTDSKIQSAPIGLPSADAASSSSAPYNPRSSIYMLAHNVEFGPTPELSLISPMLAFNSRDLARYLTLADMSAFRSISVFELMSGWWKRRQAVEERSWEEEEELMASLSSEEEGKKDSDTKTISSASVMHMNGVEEGSIEAFTRRANMLSYWVSHEIVSTKGAKTRRLIIRKFIEAAKICRSFNNLHTTMFITMALTSASVQRLSSTWKLMSVKDMNTLRSLEQLLEPSGNMRNYRLALQEATPPMIPFLPMLLKDVTFILEGNPTMVLSRSPTAVSEPHGSSRPAVPGALPKDPLLGRANLLINFDKFRRLTYYVKNAVEMAKTGHYPFENLLMRQARIFKPAETPAPTMSEASMQGSSFSQLDSIEEQEKSVQELSITPQLSSESSICNVTQSVVPTFPQYPAGNGSASSASMTDSNRAHLPPPLPPTLNSTLTLSSMFSRAAPTAEDDNSLKTNHPVLAGPPVTTPRRVTPRSSVDHTNGAAAEMGGPSPGSLTAVVATSSGVPGSVPMTHSMSNMSTMSTSTTTSSLPSGGPLDPISEIVERRLVEASGLYGVHQRVIEVEFRTDPYNTNGNEGIIRSAQGEQDYLMGMSYLCEPK